MTARDILAAVAGGPFISIFTHLGPGLQACQPGITHYRPVPTVRWHVPEEWLRPSVIHITASSKEKARGLCEWCSQRKTSYNPFLMTCSEMHKAERMRAWRRVVGGGEQWWWGLGRGWWRVGCGCPGNVFSIMALSLRGAVEAHYVRRLKRRHEGGGPHPHSPPVLEMDPQGRAMTLMQIRRRMWRRRARARQTDDAADIADAP